ncbi:SCO family protein [Thalassolituus sp. LLYu03]|uniref:SCO family protein n=1 Tax=Thalassolituus sp. LLYu03 TaxID=3421656 RepID=UPI003D29880F
MKKAIVLALLLSGALMAGWLAGKQNRGAVWWTAAPALPEGVVLFTEPLPVHPFEFTDQHGQAVTSTGLQGRNLLVFFGYTFCPDICPTTLMDLSRTWKQLPDPVRAQYQVVLVSIDPQRDTPEALAPYVGYFNPEFLALTGNPLALARLAADLNAVYQKVDRGESAYLMDHSANLAIVDKDGRYKGYIAPPHSASRMVPVLESLAQP